MFIKSLRWKTLISAHTRQRSKNWSWLVCASRIKRIERMTQFSLPLAHEPHSNFRASRIGLVLTRKNRVHFTLLHGSAHFYLLRTCLTERYEGIAGGNEEAGRQRRAGDERRGGEKRAEGRRVLERGREWGRGRGRWFQRGRMRSRREERKGISARNEREIKRRRR